MTDGKGNKRLVVLLVVLALVFGIGLGVVVLGVPLVLTAVQQARGAARREQAVNNLKQLQLALENYHERQASPVVAGSSLADALVVIKSKKFLDLTHAFEPGIPHWPGFPDEKRETVYWYDVGKGTMGKGFFAQQFTHVGQWGTHCDPPAHFVKGKRTIDQIDPKEMILPLVVIDVHEKVARNTDFTISMDDVRDWQRRHGPIPEGAFVAMRTDWSKRWPDAKAMRNEDSKGVAHYPGWSNLPRLLDTVDAARSCYRHGPDRIEVIVADNGSTDDTPQIAQARGCCVEHVSKRLIAAARNGGASAARGEILAFADADFRLHPETFNYIDAVMQHPGYIGGATGITMERWSLGIAVTWYLIMPPLWLYGIDGGVWFCRRSDFQEIGGYNETVPLGEDVEFLRRLKRRGTSRRPKQKLATRFTARKLGLEPATVLNSSCKWDRHGDWHMFPDVLRGAFYLLFARHKLKEYARRYWYEDRP